MINTIRRCDVCCKVVVLSLCDEQTSVLSFDIAGYQVCIVCITSPVDPSISCLHPSSTRTSTDHNKQFQGLKGIELNLSRKLTGRRFYLTRIRAFELDNVRLARDDHMCCGDTRLRPMVHDLLQRQRRRLSPLTFISCSSIYHYAC